MIFPRPTIRRRFLAGLVPLLLALGALPLLAPTCGGGAEGMKTFSRHSLIIPMDVCYQSQQDWYTSGGNRVWHTYAPAAGCPTAQDPGSVIKAYGLVYQLIRNNIAVYWIIGQSKTALTDYDMQVQYDGGFPVLKYNWSTRQPGGAPAITDTIIRYRGGPFVVDGSDYDRALQVLRAYEGTFGSASGAPVNIHISNVAFQGYAKKTMAGGWSAGGTIPPKLALLDIGSGQLGTDRSGNLTISDPKNAQPVISGYLVEAGIGTGTAAGTAPGPHGEIYDRLTIEDFQPAAGSSDPHTSRLFTNGYEILWVPHWLAPGSCSSYTAGGGRTASQNCVGSLYTETKISQTLKTIGAFVAEGKDLFAECAGLGSFEGAFLSGHTGTADSDYTLSYKKGDPATKFQTTVGVRYNEVDADTAQLGRPAPRPGVPGQQLQLAPAPARRLRVQPAHRRHRGLPPAERHQLPARHHPAHHRERLVPDLGLLLHPAPGDGPEPRHHRVPGRPLAIPACRGTSRSPARGWCSTPCSTWVPPAPPAGWPATPASWASAAGA